MCCNASMRRGTVVRCVSVCASRSWFSSLVPAAYTAPVAVKAKSEEEVPTTSTMGTGSNFAMRVGGDGSGTPQENTKVLAGAGGGVDGGGVEGALVSIVRVDRVRERGWAVVVVVVVRACSSASKFNKESLIACSRSSSSVNSDDSGALGDGESSFVELLRISLAMRDKDRVRVRGGVSVFSMFLGAGCGAVEMLPRAKGNGRGRGGDKHRRRKGRSMLDFAHNPN